MKKHYGFLSKLAYYDYFSNMLAFCARDFLQLYQTELRIIVQALDSSACIFLYCTLYVLVYFLVIENTCGRLGLRELNGVLLVCYLIAPGEGNVGCLRLWILIERFVIYYCKIYTYLSNCNLCWGSKVPSFLFVAALDEITTP